MLNQLKTAKFGELKTIYEDRYSYQTDVKFTDLSPGIGRLKILTKQPAIVSLTREQDAQGTYCALTVALNN